MRRKILLSVVILLSLFIITGCTKDSNSVVGTYKISKIETKDKTYTAKEWKDMTTLDYSLEMKKDNTAIITMKYKKNMTEEDNEEKEYYTYDGGLFYGTSNNGTEKGVKYYSYEYENGTLRLSVLGSETNDVYVYTKK